MNSEEGAANTSIGCSGRMWAASFSCPKSSWPKARGILVAGDFCHPFPDKHGDKDLLSPETGAEQPDSTVGPN